jgi:hypothetical protein
MACPMRSPDDCRTRQNARTPITYHNGITLRTRSNSFSPDSLPDLRLDAQRVIEFIAIALC